MCLFSDFRQSFSLFDSDADGQLSGDEIEKMFQVAGLNPTKKELENIMTTGDKNGRPIIVILDCRHVQRYLPTCKNREGKANNSLRIRAV